MNRQRLTALLMATAVLAGVTGLLNGGGYGIMSRTWADGAPAATHLAGKAKVKVKAPVVKVTKDGRTLKVVTPHGRTWT